MSTRPGGNGSFQVCEPSDRCLTKANARAPIANPTSAAWPQALHDGLKAALIATGKAIGRIVSRSGKETPALWFVFPFYHMGGAEKVHARIVESLHNEHPWVLITHKSHDRSLKHLFASNARLFDISRFVSSKLLRPLCAGFLAGLISGSCQTIIFGSNSPFFYYLLPWLPSTAKCIDLLHAFGGGLEEISLPLVSLIETRIVVNEQTLLDLASQYEAQGLSEDLMSRVVLIENCTPVPRSHCQKPEGDRLNVIYVGRGTAEKRVHLIAELAARCADKGIPADFTFVGDVRESIDSRYHEHCNILGQVVDPDVLAAIYQRANILVLASVTEGFPLAIMEAMAHGVVPICTDVGGIRFHVTHGFNGLLVSEFSEPLIVSSFVAIIEQLYRDRDLLGTMSLRAYLHAREAFSEELFRDRYRRLLGKTRNAEGIA